MSKVAILTDSNSGITQAQSKDMGVTVIPMPFFIDGVEYLEDINLTQEEFYEKLKNDADISTSQPSIGTLQDYFDELLKDNDEVVFIPMSSGLSGTCQTATMVAGDYDGKVQVVNNQRISVTMRQSVMDAKAPMMLAGNYKPGFRIELHIKDLNNALNASHAINMPVPMTAHMMEVMQELKNHDEGSCDHDDIIRYYERMTGVSIVKEK